MVVAGYDQSAGAGVLSDIKTLEAHQVYGYGVCTGMTYQNERTVRRVDWLKPEDIIEQIDLCYASAAFSWVKIGITASMKVAGAIIDHLRLRNPGVRIVLDPVIRASSGKEFWSGKDTKEWEALAARCYLVMPNWEEAGWLYPGDDIAVRCAALSARTGCHILLKGGHHPEAPGQDFLWSGGQVELLDGKATGVFPKHGSGCVLSSAVTANLALGYDLREAAVRAKRYIEKFMGSNSTLLGWH